MKKLFKINSSFGNVTGNVSIYTQYNIQILYLSNLILKFLQNFDFFYSVDCKKEVHSGVMSYICFTEFNMKVKLNIKTFLLQMKLQKKWLKLIILDLQLCSFQNTQMTVMKVLSGMLK